MDTITPVLDQESFRGRDDDVALNSGTFNGGGGLDGDWTQDTDTNFRLRYEIQETAGGDAKNLNFSLQYNKNSGGWVNVTLVSSNVIVGASGQYADQDATTQVIGDGSFVVGDGVENPSIQTGNTSILSESTECEFVLRIVGSDVSDSDTIEIRCQADAADLDSYTQSPIITVNKPGGGTRRIMVVT